MFAIERLVMRLDTWVNALTGVGTQRDKGTYGQLLPNPLSEVELDRFYTYDDMAAKMADKPAEFYVKGLVVTVDPEFQDRVTKAVQQVLIPTVQLALAYEAAYGGSAIVAVIDQPIDKPTDFAPGTYNLDYLVPYTRFDLSGTSGGSVLATRAFGPNHRPGAPFLASDFLSVDGFNRSVHKDRVLLFAGAGGSRRERMTRNGWGVATTEQAYMALRIWNGIWGVVPAIVQESSMGVFKMKGLGKMQGSEARTSWYERMLALDMGKSVTRSIVLDRDTEDFVRAGSSLGSLPELLDRVIVRMATAADMPVAILAGREPAGLNASGASDLAIWGGRIVAQRPVKVTPVVDRLVQVLFGAKNGPTDGRLIPYRISYGPMWESTEAEQATTLKTKAEVLGSFLSNRLITPDEGRVLALRDLEIDPIGPVARRTDKVVAMLMLDDASAKRVHGLAVDKRADLHVTLVYADGVDATEVEGIDWPALLGGAREFQVEGVTLFAPSEDWQDPDHVAYPLVLLVNGLALRAAHSALWARLGRKPKGAHDFVPHVTVAYVDELEVPPQVARNFRDVGSVTVDRVRVAVTNVDGQERTWDVSL